MNFHRIAAAFQFHSSTKLTLDYEIARLVRAKEDARWRQYDEPAYLRKQRALEGERPESIFHMKQAS
jgi:hypothetical protein